MSIERVPETEDEKRVNAVAAEVRALMEKHELGGVVVLVSPDSASWITSFPSWSGLQPDAQHGMRLRLRSKDPGGNEKATATMHLIVSTRDICSDITNAFGALWRQAKRALEAQGAVVEHKPFGGGAGVFPAGRRGR